MNLSDRFWSKVDTYGGEDKCWLWNGALNNKGYGMFNIKGRISLAHRTSFAMNNNTIPDGICVLHHCDTPRCVNPNHLFTGTHTENMQDSLKKGRKASNIKTHCKNGHEFKEGSFYLVGRAKRRRCKECYLNYQNNYRKSK